MKDRLYNKWDKVLYLSNSVIHTGIVLEAKIQKKIWCYRIDTKPGKWTPQHNLAPAIKGEEK